MIFVQKSGAVDNFPDWPSLVVCLVTSFVGYIKVFWNTTFLISLPVGSVKNFDHIYGRHFKNNSFVSPTIVFQ